MCWLIEVCRNDALRVHLLNHCTIVAGSWFNLTQFPFLTNSTSFTIVIALLWNGWTLFISVSVIHSWESLFHSKHKWQGLHVFLVPDVTHLYHTHLQTSRQHWECQSALRLCSFSFLRDYVFLVSVITSRQGAGPVHFRMHHKQFTRH